VLCIGWKGTTVVVASQKSGAGGDADKSKYMVMSADQNAGQNQYVKADGNSFERVEQYKCLGGNYLNISNFCSGRY
jgi:hypothetical protein